eukprot:scaffold31000_cov73-Cyclotella_meneghiniana.AAC.1
MDGTVAMGVTTYCSVGVRDSVFVGMNVINVAITLVNVKLLMKYKFHSTLMALIKSVAGR